MVEDLLFFIYGLGWLSLVSIINAPENPLIEQIFFKPPLAAHPKTGQLSFLYESINCDWMQT